jgi:hypothetical protein
MKNMNINIRTLFFTEWQHRKKSIVRVARSVFGMMPKKRKTRHTANPDVQMLGIEPVSPCKLLLVDK